jgi:hypothetical protein
MPRFEDEQPFRLEPPTLPAQPKPKKPAPVLRIEVPTGGMSIDHLRSILPAKKPKRGKAWADPSRQHDHNRYFREDDRPKIRRRKETTKANRKSRGGRRAQLFATPPNRFEAMDIEQDEIELAASRIRRSLPPAYGACPPGPCGYVKCRHHLATDEEIKKGERRLKVNFPHLPVWEMKETCSLRVADEADLRKAKPGSFERVMSLDEIGERMNLSAERVRNIESNILRKLRARPEILGLRDGDAQDDER